MKINSMKMRFSIYYSKLIAIFVAALFIANVCPLKARLREGWSFREMFDRADFVVIARVVASRDKGQLTTLPNFDPALKVIEVLTEFESLLLVKGAKDTVKFELRHYRYQSEEEEFAAANNPQLIKINPGEQPAFLLFLVKERDGKYAPFGGQIDPAAMSVFDLRAGVD